MTSGQDGGIGRYALLPHTTKRRTTTNLKTKNKKNLQKNQTVWKYNKKGVQEEPFIQTGRRGRDRLLGWRGHAARWQLVDRAVPHSFVDKPGRTTGEWDRLHNPGFQHGKLEPQNL